MDTADVSEADKPSCRCTIVSFLGGGVLMYVGNADPDGRGSARRLGWLVIIREL